MISEAFLLAFKNLKHKGVRSWLTMLGIFIGITSVVALISLGNGLTMAVNSQFGMTSTEVISVQAGGLNSFGPPGSGAVSPLTTEDMDVVKKVRGVERVIRRNLPTGKLEFNDIVGFGVAINIPDGDDRDFVYDMLELELEEGRFLKDGDTHFVMLGYNFYADKAGFEKPIRAGNRIILQDEVFTVVGITKKKGSFIFDNLVYVNEKTLEDLMEYGDEIDVLGVKVKDSNLMDEVKEDIEKVLRKSRDVDKGEEDFEVSTPEAAMASINSILNGVQIFVFMIASISIIVGAIGIVNTMTTSVLERRKEIGIMKAIGARNSQIFLLFLVESGLMGLIGSLVGIIVGVSIGYFGTVGINNWIGSDAVPSINYLLVIFTLIGGFLIGSVAGITPAIKAAKQNPVDALRG
jgi:putative ABC transport system permease protein